MSTPRTPTKREIPPPSSPSSRPTARLTYPSAQQVQSPPASPSSLRKTASQNSVSRSNSSASSASSTSTVPKTPSRLKSETNGSVRSKITPARTTPGAAAKNSPAASTPSRTPRPTPSTPTRTKSSSTASNIDGLPGGSPRTPNRVSVREQIASKRREMRAAQASATSTTLEMEEGSLGEELRSIKSRSEASSFGNDVSTGVSESGEGAGGDIFGRTTNSLISKAMRTGKLNLANMDLEQLPREVWTRILGLSEEEIEDPLPSPSSSTLSLSRTPSTPSRKSHNLDSYGEFDTPPHIKPSTHSSPFSSRRGSSEAEEVEDIPYYEIEDVVAIKVSGNALKRLPRQIAMFGALRSLDLHANQLTELPDSLIDLRELTTLDASQNQLNRFPSGLTLHPSLTTLNLASNQILEVDFSNPARPTPSILSHIHDNSTLSAFPSTPTKSKLIARDHDIVLPSLKVLLMGKNRVTNSGLPREWPAGLEEVDLGENGLRGMVDLGVLLKGAGLKVLRLGKNGITGIKVDGAGPDTRGSTLEVLDLSENAISDGEAVRHLFPSRSGFQLLLEGNPLDSSISAKTKARSEIVYRPYAGEEEDMADIMRLVDEDLSEPYNISTFRYFLQDGGHLAFVALPPINSGVEQRPIACVICKQEMHRAKRSRGYIGMLSVTKEWRRRGIARKLANLAIEAMKQNNADEVVLETECDNSASLALYGSLGFIREKRLHRFYLNGKDAYRLVLPLKSIKSSSDGDSDSEEDLPSKPTQSTSAFPRQGNGIPASLPKNFEYSQGGEVTVEGAAGKEMLDKDRNFHLQDLAASHPPGSNLHTITLSGIIPLRGLVFPKDSSFLSSVRTLRVVNTALESNSELFPTIARTMRSLEELDLTGSFLTHLSGIDKIVSNGLVSLRLKGGRIEDFSAIENVAEQVREGSWTGKMRLEELDIRDNNIAKLIPAIGCLPLRVLLVENNAFRIPNRRHWEKGTEALLSWLRDGL